MRCHLPVLTLLLAAVPLLAVAQTRPPVRKAAPRTAPKTSREETILPQNIIKINPLSLFTVTTNFTYERVITERMSAQVGVFYTFPSISIGNTNFRGFGITPEVRFYLTKSRQAPTGFYVAPYLRYQRFTLSYRDPNDPRLSGDGSLTSFSGGGLIGGQWLLGNVVSFDIFLGLGIHGLGFSTEVPQLRQNVRLPIPGGVAPRLGLTLGVAF